MKFKDFIGIDISKKTLDVHIYSTKTTEVFENGNSGFKKIVKWFETSTHGLANQAVFIFEHTGLYSHNLSLFLERENIPFVIVPGLEIKRSMGLTRGKEDKIDAKRIAIYGFRLRDELIPVKLPSKQLADLKILLGLRDRLVKQKSGYLANLKESKAFMVRKENEVFFKVQETMIKTLSKEIKIIEATIKGLINADESLKRNFNLLVSIKGVGPQTAAHMIAYTDNFSKFKTWRKFASYSGIAPFPHSSGTSIRGKNKVSHLANKKMKTLFDLCAKTAIQYNQEMKQFYNKRVEQGKNKMSTINIIRNKLLARMFAVIERKTPYVDIYKYAA